MRRAVVVAGISLALVAGWAWAQAPTPPCEDRLALVSALLDRYAQDRQRLEVELAQAHLRLRALERAAKDGQP